MLAIISRILKVAEDYKWRIRIAFVFSFLKAMFGKMPIAISFYVISDFIQQTITPKRCLWAGVLLVACVILQCICQNVADRLQSAAGYMVFADMRMKLGTHLRKLPMGCFTEGNIGKISSVLSTDMVFIEENSMMVIADMMSFLFSQFVMVTFMFFFHVWLGVAALVISLLIVLLGCGMKNNTMKHSDTRQEQSEKLTDTVLDFAEGIGIIKTYNLLGEKSKELSYNFEESCKVSLAFEREQSPWQSWLNIFYGIGSVAVLALSLLLYGKGILDVTYVIGMALFIFELFAPLKAFYGQISRLTVMNSCLDRIEAVFNETELSDEGTESIPALSDCPEIEYRNVSFAYEEKEVLKDISFTVNQNEMLALVGPSGGGKSTIANLFARFWDVKNGEILVRGKDIRKLPLSELMNHISMVFQRVYLFQDTIYNNISMGRPEATREEVIEAAKKARCYDFIMALPEGFDTVIGEGGASLSGGEQQRVSIARCILKDAPIVILDEATASVDADNESYIQSAISELCKGKTLLVIAHRLHTIYDANQILVVANGRIAERGNHEKLVVQKGIYHNMVSKREGSRSWSN